MFSVGQRWWFCGSMLGVIIFSSVFCDYVSSHKDDLSCSKTSQQSYLWQIRGVVPVYLFGTIHVPFSTVASYLAPVVYKAFEATQNIYFELDLGDASTIKELQNCQLLPHNRTLRDILPLPTFIALKSYFANIRKLIPSWLPRNFMEKDFHAQIFFQQQTKDWIRKRPIWIIMLMNMLTPTVVRHGFEPVLDVHLMIEAKSKYKEVFALEAVQEQCGPLNDLNNKMAIYALDFILRQLQQITSLKQEPFAQRNPLIDHYNCGDLTTFLYKRDMSYIPHLFQRDNINSSVTKKLLKINDYFEKVLIDRRNVVMAERIGRIIGQNPTTQYFFALGAGHFLSERGSVLEHLRQAGFHIEAVPRTRTSVWERYNKQKYNFSASDNKDDYKNVRETWIRPISKHSKYNRINMALQTTAVSDVNCQRLVTFSFLVYWILQRSTCS